MDDQLLQLHDEQDAKKVEASIVTDIATLKEDRRVLEDLIADIDKETEELGLVDEDAQDAIEIQDAEEQFDYALNDALLDMATRSGSYDSDGFDE